MLLRPSAWQEAQGRSLGWVVAFTVLACAAQFGDQSALCPGFDSDAYTLQGSVSQRPLSQDTA